MKKNFSVIFALILLTIPFKTSALGTSAKAAILINADTGEVIFEQNADERLPMASTTKIMTALLLCENGDFRTEITVTAEMLRVEGSSMGLLAGDKVTLHDLLYGMMLASGNDAANVTAYVLGGTVDGFVKKMNDKAEELGLRNTHFKTPSGLDSQEHYSTARDMAVLAAYALKNEAFAAAAACEKATLNYGNPPYRRSLTNHNKLLKTFDGAVGVKTGFTKKSGRCLVSAAKRDGKRVIAVTLNDSNDWNDHTALLEYGLSAIKTATIDCEKSKYEIPVINGVENSVTVSVEPYKVSFVKEGDFVAEIMLPKFVYAPIKKGEYIGSVKYMKGDSIIDTVDLSADCDISPEVAKPSIFAALFENLKYVFKNIWVK